MADNEEESGPAAEGTSALQGSRRANCATRGQRVNLAASAIPRLVYINNDLDPVSSIAARGEELSISASQRVYPYEGRPFSDEVETAKTCNALLADVLALRDISQWKRTTAPPRAITASERQMAALSDVVATGTANDVRMLLKSGAYVNCRDRQGRTPLQTALLRGDAAIVEALLIEGASIMFTGDAGTTLRFTASNQNRCILASLRAMAAFPNMSALCLPARNVSRETALAVAGAGKIDALSAFLLSISPFDATSLVEALRQALAFQQYDAVRILLCCWRRGVMNPSDGRTPLHVAASAGYLEVLFALMMVGENSNARDHAGQTALHVAVAAGQIHIAGTLVRMGASLVARDYRARTPIQLAIRAKNAEMVEALFQQTRAWSRVQNEADNLVAELTEAVDGGNSSVVAAVYRGLVSNECINDLLVDQAVHRGRGDIVSVALNSRALANSKNENGRTPLHFAAATGRCDLAQVLLQGGAAVDEPGGIDGTTALHLASAEGHGDVVELLLGSGASVCAADNVGSTPLLYAALKRKSTFSKRVRQPEVAVDFPDSETISSLRVAVVRDFARVVGTLTAYGASTSGALCAAIHNDDDVTLCALLKSGTWSLVRLTGVCALLQMATKAKSLRAMKVLLAFGAGSNVKDTTSRTTPLHVGAENWFGNGVRLLLCAKANPRALDTRGCSALMVAACRGHCYVVQLLLKAGANPDVADADGNTALHMAARHGHGGTIAVLVRNAQVDVNVLNTKQESALYFALEVGDRESVISLLGAGASVTTGFCSYGSAVYLAAHRGLDGFLLGMRDFGISADLEGEGVISPLLHAAHCQDDAAVLTLLQHHASVSRVYGGGDTIMHRTTDPRSMTWLMKLDAPVNGCNTRNFTPLHCAAIGGRAAVLEVLLSDRKAWDDIDAKTDENMTALMYAVDGWHNASVEVLVSSGASVRVPTYNGRTALHLAVEKDFVHAVKTIVDGDTFAIHIEDNDGVCPLHMALEDSHLDALRFLLMDPAGIIRRDHPSQLRGCTALHLAVWEGRIEAVKQLLQRTDSVNSFNCERQTPLHFASAYSNVEVVRMLLAGGAFLGARDSQRATPLHVAVFFDRHDIALVLLRAGAPVGEENIDGNTALHIACSGGGRFALSMACALLGHGAPTTCRNVDGLTPLHLAVQSSRADIALAVLEERGGQLSAISHPDEDMGHTPLHSAVQANAGDMVAILLKFGAPVNKQNIEGASPLYVACEEGYFAIAQRLLRSEASPGTGGRGGMTPLHAVCLNGHTNLVRLLLERGALPGHCMNAEGTSPLHVAVEGKYLRVVKTLLPRLAASHINRHSKNGETPLIMGVRQQDEKVVDALLEAGADPNERDFDGRKPLSIAADAVSSPSSTALVCSLLSAGGNPSLFCDKGFLPLHTACTTGGDVGIVRMLLDAGTAVNSPCPGARFHLPLHLAAYHGHAEAVRALTCDKNCGLNEKANYSRNTPLTMAVSNGHTEAVRALLEAGALLERSVLDIRGANLRSHVHVAIGNGYGDSCRLLLQAMVFESRAGGAQP